MSYEYVAPIDWSAELQRATDGDFLCLIDGKLEVAQVAEKGGLHVCEGPRRGWRLHYKDIFGRVVERHARSTWTEAERK